MGVIRDNVFSKDTYGDRTERLIAIQGNFASVQSELNAPSNIVEWAVDCETVYSNLLANYSVTLNSINSANMLLKEMETSIGVEYQTVRQLAKSLYVDNASLIADYGFNVPFPRRRSEKLSRVEQVLKTFEHHKSIAITPLIPEFVIDRLAEAKSKLESAIENVNLKKLEARHNGDVFHQRFDSDTKMLNLLKTWWFATMGKDHPKLTVIEMVNPKKARRRKNI